MQPGPHLVQKQGFDLKGAKGSHHVPKATSNLF